MTDLNEVCISGMIMREPMLRKTKTDHDMCSLQVSVKRPDPSNAHDYLDVVLWEENAKQFADAFHAGDRVIVKGRLKKTNYTGMDGLKHVSTQIVAEYAGYADDSNQVCYTGNTEAAACAESLA